MIVRAACCDLSATSGATSSRTAVSSASASASGLAFFIWHASANAGLSGCAAEQAHSLATRSSQAALPLVTSASGIGGTRTAAGCPWMTDPAARLAS